MKIENICVVFCKGFFLYLWHRGGVACHILGNDFKFFEKFFGVKPTTNSMYGAAQKYSGFQTVTAP